VKNAAFVVFQACKTLYHGENAGRRRNYNLQKYITALSGSIALLFWFLWLYMFVGALKVYFMTVACSSKVHT